VSELIIEEGSLRDSLREVTEEERAVLAYLRNRIAGVVI
jgi:hypothetical protein